MYDDDRALTISFFVLSPFRLFGCRSRIRAFYQPEKKKKKKQKEKMPREKWEMRKLRVHN